jgi:hypothetical protein
MTFQPGNEHGKNSHCHSNKGKSAVTLGRRLLTGRVNVHAGTTRRYRDLIAIHSRGFASIGEHEMALIKMAAAMTVQAEAMQVQILNGVLLDEKKLSRVAGTIARTLDKIRRLAAEQRLERRAPSRSSLSSLFADIGDEESSSP